MARAPRTASATDVRVGLQAVEVGMTPFPATTSPGCPQTWLCTSQTEVPSSTAPILVLPW